MTKEKQNELNEILWYTCKYAYQVNSIETVKEIIAQGANINLQNNEGDTPLHLTSQVQSFDTIKLLFSNNVQFNIKNNDNYTPLDLIINSDEFTKNHITKDIINAFKKYEQYDTIKQTVSSIVGSEIPHTSDDSQLNKNQKFEKIHLSI